jgi:hypothetical protein
MGIGIGAKNATVPIFSAELAPARIRGALVMFWQLWVSFYCRFGRFPPPQFSQLRKPFPPPGDARFQLYSSYQINPPDRFSNLAYHSYLIKLTLNPFRCQLLLLYRLQSRLSRRHRLGRRRYLLRVLRKCHCQRRSPYILATSTRIRLYPLIHPSLRNLVHPRVPKMVDEAW